MTETPEDDPLERQREAIAALRRWRGVATRRTTPPSREEAAAAMRDYRARNKGMPTKMAASDYPYLVRDFIKATEARSIDFPTEVTEAIASWQRVTAGIPEVPKRKALTDAIIDGADDGTLASTLLAHLGGSILADAWRLAAGKAARVALDCIYEHRAIFHGQLGVLADDAIAHINRVAGLHGRSLNTLVREGRHDEARDVADIELQIKEFLTLIDIRNGYLVGDAHQLRVDGVDASMWKNIADVSNHIHGDTQTEQILAGVRGGGILWYPTLEEARAAAQPVADAIAAEEAARRAEQFGIGSVAAW